MLKHIKYEALRQDDSGDCSDYKINKFVVNPHEIAALNSPEIPGAVEKDSIVTGIGPYGPTGLGKNSIIWWNENKTFICRICCNDGRIITVKFKDKWSINTIKKPIFDLKTTVLALPLVQLMRGLDIFVDFAVAQKRVIPIINSSAMVTYVNSTYVKVIAPCSDYFVLQYRNKYLDAKNKNYIVPVGNFSERPRFPQENSKLPNLITVFKGVHYLKNSDDSFTKFRVNSNMLFNPHKIDPKYIIEKAYYIDTPDCKFLKNKTILKRMSQDLNDILYFRRNDFGWPTNLNLYSGSMPLIELNFAGTVTFSLTTKYSGTKEYTIHHDVKKVLYINCINNSIIDQELLVS